MTGQINTPRRRVAKQSELTAREQVLVVVAKGQPGDGVRMGNHVGDQCPGVGVDYPDAMVRMT